MARRWFEGLKLVRLAREAHAEWRGLKQAEHNAAIEAKKLHVRMSVLNEVRREQLDQLKFAHANAHKLIAQAAAHKAKQGGSASGAGVATVSGTGAARTSASASPGARAVANTTPSFALAAVPVAAPAIDDAASQFKADMLGRLDALLPEAGHNNPIIRGTVHDTVKDAKVEGNDRAQMAASMVASVAVSTDMSDEDTMELIDSLVFDDNKVRDQVKANVQQALDNARAAAGK